MNSYPGQNHEETVSWSCFPLSLLVMGGGDWTVLLHAGFERKVKGAEKMGLLSPVLGSSQVAPVLHVTPLLP